MARDTVVLALCAMVVVCLATFTSAQPCIE